MCSANAVAVCGVKGHKELQKESPSSLAIMTGQHIGFLQVCVCKCNL